MNDPVLVMLNYLTNKLNDMAKEIENLREDLKVERDCGDRLRDELTKAEMKTSSEVPISTVHADPNFSSGLHDLMSAQRSGSRVGMVKAIRSMAPYPSLLEAKRLVDDAIPVCEDCRNHGQRSCFHVSTSPDYAEVEDGDRWDDPI